MARHSEMKMESNGEFPVTPGDFKKILKSLINNPTNEIKVYDVFHKFHRDRIWIAHAIDKWFLREKMILEGEVRIQKQNGKCAKFFATDRGWFFFCCTNSKGTDREIIYALFASKYRMVYRDNE